MVAVGTLRQAKRVGPQLPPGFEERRARYLIDLARALSARRRDVEAVRALLEAERAVPEEVRTHRLTRSVLIDLIGRERRGAVPELRPLARRCGALA